MKKVLIVLLSAGALAALAWHLTRPEPIAVRLAEVIVAVIVVGALALAFPTYPLIPLPSGWAYRSISIASVGNPSAMTSSSLCVCLSSSRIAK